MGHTFPGNVTSMPISEGRLPRKDTVNERGVVVSEVLRAPPSPGTEGPDPSPCGPRAAGGGSGPPIDGSRSVPLRVFPPFSFYKTKQQFLVRAFSPHRFYVPFLEVKLCAVYCVVLGVDFQCWKVG